MIFDKVKAIYAEQMEKLAEPERQLSFQQAVILRTVDTNWSDHIDQLDQMRQSVGLRGYAQIIRLLNINKKLLICLTTW